MVRPDRFERPTFWFVAKHSRGISYLTSFDVMLLSNIFNDLRDGAEQSVASPSMQVVGILWTVLNAPENTAVAALNTVEPSPSVPPSSVPDAGTTLFCALCA